MGGQRLPWTGQSPWPDGRNCFVDMKLEVVVVPVSGVDRAKEFYEYPGRVRSDWCERHTVDENFGACDRADLGASR